MSDSFSEALKLLVKKGFGAEVTIPAGQGFPATENQVVGRLQSVSVDPNGVNIRTFEGTVLTPENAPGIAVYGSVGEIPSFVEIAAILAAKGFKAEVVIPQGEGFPEVEEEITEEVQSITLGPSGIFIRTMSGRALTQSSAPRITHFSS